MSQIPFKRCLQLLVMMLGVMPALSNSAEITIKLKEPQWEFLLNNQPWGETDAQLSPNESSFARELQPLLAAQDHQAIIKAFEKRQLDNDSVALRLLRGQVLISLKRYKEAEIALQSALQNTPNLALAHRSLSMLYMQEKQYQKARKHLTRSIELGVSDAQVYGQLAFVNLQLGQAASAVAGYQYALFLQADNNQWRQGLLFAFIQSQAFDQAQALVEELLQSEPDNADLWLQRGQIALKQQRSQQAIASMEAALAINSHDVNNIATLAQLHIQSGSPRRAVELLTQHTKTLVTSGKVDVLDQIASWLAFEQDWRQLNQLIQALNRGKNKLPIQYRSRFALYHAQLALAEGHQKSANKHLRYALKTDPTNGDALLTLATLLRDKQQSEQAILYYTRAEALPSFKERSMLGRAQLEINRQHYPQALSILRTVLQNNPARNDLSTTIESLQHLVRSQG